MKKELIAEIEKKMESHLNGEQRSHLHMVLSMCLSNVLVAPIENSVEEKNNKELTSLFLSAKKVEGCSERTIYYYNTTINGLFKRIEKRVNQITTTELRQYLAEYPSMNQCSKETIDNIRRILSSFFSWLEEEDHIVKSPMRRIHKVKTSIKVKSTYSDENLERLRDGCKENRDLAIIDLLDSTGMRVGELVKLNRDDINFNERTCIVFGKGDKEREVYFDARTKIHLQNYLNSREDNNPALFVSLLKPNNRLKISGVEIRLRELGRMFNMEKVHPHKFRRTLATRAIDKGMPIEQVQHLLGHQKIDTTLEYAMVDQANVKYSHKKYLG